MRIIGLDEFLKMPIGTVFAKYEPCVFEELMIKAETLPEIKDFCYQSIIQIDIGQSGDCYEALLGSEKTGKAVGMDLALQGRDGCFDENQLFAVYDRSDVELLIQRLQQALIDSSDTVTNSEGS
ncbi:hypothetical protein [Pseudomonas syringae]|uniref:hypothetical protein n=1 Tax=Pseudomonas syringae TaxID=317 RepID=UPI000462FF11|nr:hypothetical protein [Pseudomonas syringae]